MSTRQSPIEPLLDAASKFEETHYEDKDASGGAEPLKKSDFDNASEKDEEKKSVASSAAEPSRGAISQLLVVGLAIKEAIAPTALALERSSDDKWADAKQQARESGRQANASARDAMGAIGDRVDRWGNKIGNEAERVEDKADRWAENRKEDVQRAGDKTQGAFYNADASARGVAAEAADLGRRAADRVQGDWQDVKEATKETANNSTTARQHREAREAEERAKAEGRGFFGWIKDLTGTAGDKADDVAKRAEATGRSAANNVRDSANSAYYTAQDKAQEGKEETRGWFQSASHDANDAKDRARRTGYRAADTMADKTESGKHMARDYMSYGSESAEDASRRGRYEVDRAADQGGSFVDAAGNKLSNLKHRAGHRINRFGERISDAAEDAEQWTKETMHEVGDYMTADLGPHSSSEAAVQRGYIPSNTADVMSMLSRRYR